MGRASLLEAGKTGKLASEADSIDGRTVNQRIWTAFLLAGTFALPARAAEPTKAEIAVARQYFDAATAAENQGRWRDAIDQLTKAIAIKETAGLRYHLGFAKENLGLLVDALLEYQRASGLIHSGMTTEEVDRFVVPKLEEMRKRVPTLTVTLPPDVTGAKLQIDGAAVKPELIGTPIPLNPGTHALVVFASGRRPFHVQVTVSEGSAVTQAAELVPEVGGAGGAPAASSLPTPPPTTRAEPRRDASGEATSGAKTWVLIGEAAVAAAGIGVGIGYLSAASAAQTRIDDANRYIDLASNGMGCAGMPTPTLMADCDALATALNDHRRDTSFAIAGFVGAGVGAAAFVTTLVVWKTSPREASSMRVTPMLAAGGGGISLAWTY
jgi:hypothetical protein